MICTKHTHCLFVQFRFNNDKHILLLPIFGLDSVKNAEESAQVAEL